MLFYISRAKEQTIVQSRRIASNASNASYASHRDMKVLIVCSLMLHQLQIAEPIARHRWQQQPRDRFQFERAMDRVDEIPRPLENDAMLLLDRPTPEERKQIVTDYQELESPERIHVQTRSSCSCESQYEMIDLGDGYYPRYLPASRCKPKTCQNKFHSCKLLPYMVYVLRSREIIAKTAPKDDDKIPETPLPESLRPKWQLKPMTISVACVPA